MLPNGLSLTYGQIVALGGDFYGIPDKPISDGSHTGRPHRPLHRSLQFAGDYERRRHRGAEILAVMQTEIDAVNKALKEGKPASEAYKALGDTLSEKWNKITGGGSLFRRGTRWAATCSSPPSTGTISASTRCSPIRPGMRRRSRKPWRRRACQPNQQRQALSWAYAMDAFACHFLSDLFSGGHIRTPRKELYDTVTPSDLGSLLTRIMHDEDSHWGLNVTNTTSNAWRAYGDKRYFDTVDLANKTLVDVAVQDSVDEVFNAFNTGTVPQPANYLALSRIADFTAAQKSSGAQAAGNISPLFAWTGSTTIRRNDVANLNDYSWTSNWWGWSTYALLRNYTPNTPTGYLQPPAGSPAVSPNGWQSTQSAPPNWVAGAQVRYAASVVNTLYESDIGPWGAFTTVAANQAYPTLTGVPVGPAGTTMRRIYRQFINTPCTYVGQIADNTTTTFIDNTH